MKGTVPVESASAFIDAKMFLRGRFMRSDPEGRLKSVIGISPMRLLTMLCLLTVCIGHIGAQSGQPGVFHETATGLTMRYPVELTLRDPQKAIAEGHIAAFGSMSNASKEHELASRCMTPILLAELPEEPSQEKPVSNVSSATLFFFEFVTSEECKAGFKYKDDEAVTGGIAQTAIQLPGAAALSPPLWFDFGKQKLHIAFSAIGLHNTSPDQPHGLLAIAAMRYHGHILGWLMSASMLNTFNDLTKTSIELDDGHTYPLVPFNLDDHLRLPVNIVK